LSMEKPMPSREPRAESREGQKCEQSNRRMVE
jgi:hypothetical protein